MSNFIDKLMKWVSLAALVVAIITLVIVERAMPHPDSNGIGGATGNMLAEDSSPYFRANGGFRSQLPFLLGSTTPRELIYLGGGKCNLTTGVTSTGDGAGNNTFNASTTKIHYCSAPGVRPGDQIIVTPPSGTLLTGVSSSSPLSGISLFGSLQFNGAFATTSNVFGISITNWTGAATGSYAQATTGIPYLIVR